MAGQKSDGKDAKVRFEPLDVPPLLPLWLALGLAGAIVIVFLAITWGYPLADHQENRGPLRPLPPAPRLEPAPARELARYRAAKRRELEQAPLPIEEAMRATAEQGWGPPK